MGRDIAACGASSAVCARRQPRARSCAVLSSTQSRSEEHTSELQSPDHLVCRLLLEKKKIKSYVLSSDSCDYDVAGVCPVLLLGINTGACNRLICDLRRALFITRQQVCTVIVCHQSQG